MQVGTFENLYTEDEEDYAVVYQHGENGTEEKTRKITERLLTENMEQPPETQAPERLHTFDDLTTQDQKIEVPPKTKEFQGEDTTFQEPNKVFMIHPLAVNTMMETPREPLESIEQQDIETKSGCFSWFDCPICKKIQNFFKRKKKTILKHLD
jgi:hypothetical protein